MSEQSFFRSSDMVVQPEWIDYNGHLNLAYYQVLFDRACEELWIKIGIGPDYAASRAMTTYSAECHICYVKELHEGDRVFSTARIVDFDEKRIHLYQELFHAEGWLAATLESLSLSVDMSGPKVSPWPDDITMSIAAHAVRDVVLPRPERLGRSIGIRRKS